MEGSGRVVATSSRNWKEAALSYSENRLNVEKAGQSLACKVDCPNHYNLMILAPSKKHLDRLLSIGQLVIVFFEAG